LSVTSNFGAQPCFLSSLRISRSAALAGPGLNQHVEDFALVIDRSPQIHSPAGDPPPSRRDAIGRSTAAGAAALCGDQRTKLQHPAPHRFLGNVQPTLGEKILDVPVAQREARVEPNRVLDD
jgi:hypothetical protein